MRVKNAHTMSSALLRRSLSYLCLLSGILVVISATAQRQMEPLGRGVVALRTGNSTAYVGWRLFATDPEGVAFNVYKSVNGAAGTKLNGPPLTATTDFSDNAVNFAVSNAWYVVPVLNGIEQVPSAPFALGPGAPTRQYLRLPLVEPGLHSPSATNAPYDVKFCWVGDFDGDGEYDYLVDRLSLTANVNQYLQAYKRDGTFLWQMDMGPNSTLSSGNSTTVYEPSSSAISIGDKDNVTVYDVDGDGQAEVIVRTSNGTVFDNGAVVSGGANDDVQFLSIVNGLTGVEKARATVPNPYIADGPLNCHAGIAYLDGVHPSIIFSGENRVDDGPFQRLTVAWDYRNGLLTQRWLYQTPANHNDSEGHQLRIADVNCDGKDDIVRIGSVISDNNGIPVTLYSTELVHGDRYHITDIDPERPGLEMFAIQQNNPTLLATSLQDLGSGVLYKKWYSAGIADVARGITLDLTPSYRGCEMYSTQPGIFDAKGNQIYANNLWAPEGVWWDADLLREFEDGAGSGALNPVINKFDPATGESYRLFSIYSDDGDYSTHQAYGGRAAFWGDLFGDWREELVLVGSDYAHLRIYTTKIPAANRIYCLMQNPQYRVQCTYKGYYQASYVDYYLGNDMPAVPVPPVSDAKLVWRGGGANAWDTTTANWFTNNVWVSNVTSTVFASGDTVLFDLTGSNHTAIALTGSVTPGDVRVHSPKDYTFDGTSGGLTGTTKLTKAGAGKLTLTGTHSYTGATLVSEGVLRVNGSLPNSPITLRGGVWLDGRLGGTGPVGGPVMVYEGAGVSPGQGTNSAGTLAVNANVTFTGRTLSDFDLSNNPAGTNDLLTISGNLTLQGTNTIVVHKLNATLLPGGVYPLINYSGSLSGSLNNLTVKGLDGAPYALTNPPNQIALVLIATRAPATLNWTGGQNGNTWDLTTTSNWLNGASKDWFVPDDTVRFDSVGVSNLNVNLSGTLDTASVIVDSTANYNLNGSGGITGSGGLTKLNSGTLTINTKNNTYVGTTTVAGGMLVVSELDAVGAPSPIGNPPAGSAGLVLSNGSTLRITGESYTDRGLTVNAGTNTIDVFNSADQVTIAGKIIGAGLLQKAGPGTLALSENNDHTGGTIIKAGVVALGGDVANADAFGSGLVTLDGGTINMFSSSSSYNSASWNLNVPAGSTGTLNADARVDLYGSLTGGGTLTFHVPYVRTTLFGNWSAFTGQINVTADNDGGDFRIDNSSGYANASINFGNNVYAYRNGGGATTIGAVSGSSSATMTGTTWTVGGKNTNTTFGGTISGNAIIKNGTGTWTLTGSNYYTGTTTVNAGTLMINGNSSAATGATTVNASGTLAGTGIIGANTTVGGKLAPGNNGIGTLTFLGALTLNSASTTLIEINKNTGAKDLANVSGTLTYGGTLVVSNLAGTFAAGNSYKVFNAANYAGSFISSNLPALPAGLAWDLGGLTNDGVITVVATNVGPQNLTWKGDGNGNVWNVNSTPNWLNPALSPSYFNQGDTVTFNDSGSNNTAIVLATAVQPASVTVNATKDYTFAGAGSIAGTNSLTKSGSGKLSLAVPGTYSGATTIAGGTLELLSLREGLSHRWSFNGSLADSAGSQPAALVNVGTNNATLTASNITMAGGPKATSDYIDLGDNLLPKDGSALTIEIWATPHTVQNWSRIFDFGASTAENIFMSWTRGTTLANDRVEWVDSSGTNTVNDSNQPYTLNVEYHVVMVIQPGAGSGGTTRVTWYRSPTTNSSLGNARGTFDTANTLASLLDTNCWLGYSQWPDNAANASYNEVRLWNRALNSGELQVLHNAGPDAVLLGTLPAAPALNLTGASSKLDNLSGQAQAVGSLSGVTGSEVKLTSGGIAVGAGNASSVFAGILSGTNGLIKSGTGTLTLAGNSTYTGPSTINAGTLLVNGDHSAATGPLTVSSGAILGGTGYIGGHTTIEPGGQLSPGIGIGTITFASNLTLNGKLLMETSHSPLTNDVIIKSGVLSYSGILEVTNISGSLVAGDHFQLFSASGYSGTFSSAALPPLSAGLAWDTSKLNISGTLWVVTTNPPLLSPPTNSGGNFSFTGTGGTPGWDCYLLSSTNLTLPVASWERMVTNQFDAAGNCAITVPLDLSQQAQFYRLEVP
jgi:fibronectin-binding autotransporter adhesin